MYLFIVNGICVLGLVGFIIAFYIHAKKVSKKKLICPRKSNCDTVIHSEHSKIIGIPVEVLGMLYYAAIAIAYPFISILGYWNEYVAIVVFTTTACAVVFSAYLVLIQAFVVKHWCAWCLSSAGISTAIFVLSYFHFVLHY